MIEWFVCLNKDGDLFHVKHEVCLVDEDVAAEPVVKRALHTQRVLPRLRVRQHLRVENMKLGFKLNKTLNVDSLVFCFIVCLFVVGV